MALISYDFHNTNAPKDTKDASNFVEFPFYAHSAQDM